MKLALVGSGVVGRFIGRALLARQHALVVCDLDPDATRELVGRGATVAATPKEAVSDVDVVISALPAPQDVLIACEGPDGIHAGARLGLVHVMTATIGPEAVRSLAASAKKAGVDLLDAPISAGPQAEDGSTQLTLWIGGAVSTYARLRPLIDEFARYALYCGPVGNAQIVKLVNNFATLAFIAPLSDALALGVAAGVPLETVRSALAWGTAQCRLLDELFPQSVFAGDWRPGYRLDLAQKDVGLAEDLARSLGTELATAGPLRQVLEAAAARGYGDHSVHAVARLAEERFGIKLRAEAFRDREILPE
ncbi:MAG: NAD(P)-dependent oxidoreductase [Acidobacteria bacterium]|nr:NAD(P)-dependent oxidoreductase [Acidobacteriota bacterium]